MCRSRRKLSNDYLLAKFGFDTSGLPPPPPPRMSPVKFARSSRTDPSGLLEELRELFVSSDVDGNEQLTIEEFKKMQSDERIVRLMAEMDMLLTVDQFFEALDLDGQGSISIDEFVQGVLRYQAPCFIARLFLIGYPFFL